MNWYIILLEYKKWQSYCVESWLVRFGQALLGTTVISLSISKDYVSFYRNQTLILAISTTFLKKKNRPHMQKYFEAGDVVPMC